MAQIVQIPPQRRHGAVYRTKQDHGFVDLAAQKPMKFRPEYSSFRIRGVKVLSKGNQEHDLQNV